MFETRFPQHLTRYAAELETLQDDYAECWTGLKKRFDGHPKAARIEAGHEARHPNDGTRDGRLVCVSRDLTRCAPARRYRPDPAGSARRLGSGRAAPCASWRRAHARPLRRRAFDETRCRSPLPRAYQWADGSAYVNHVELVRKARGAEMPESFWSDPLMYQGGSDAFLGPRDAIRLADEAWGIDFEAEVAVITDDVPMGASREEARAPSASSCWSTTSPCAASSRPNWPRASASSRSKPSIGLFAGRGDARRTGRGLGRRRSSACPCASTSTASRSAAPKPAMT